MNCEPVNCLLHTAYCLLTQFSKQPFDFLAHACQVLERALGCCDSGQQIVATGSAAARDLGGEVACRCGARLTYCHGLRMRLKDLEKLLALLAGHPHTFRPLCELKREFPRP